MLSLPNELLASVFELLRDYDVVEWEDAHMDDHQYDIPFRLPLILLASHVNRHFRAVAIAAPRLWAYIGFTSAFPMNYLDLMLQRSSKTLLDLHLREVSGSENFGRVLDKVIPESHRWHLLSVTIRSTATVQSLRSCESLSGPLPHLKTLLLDQQVDIDSNPWMDGRLAARSPHLTTLELTGISLLSCDSGVYSNLTALEIQPLDSPDSYPTYDVIINTLSSATRLENLSFHCDVKQSPMYPGTMISLPELRSLEVGLQDYEDGCVANLYTIFDVPKLESLRLLFVGEIIERDRQVQDFVGYIKENGLSRFPSLRDLDVTDIESSQHLDKDFFRNLPLITTASIGSFSENAILRILSEQDQQSSPPELLWPCLRHLGVEHFDMELLCDLIRHRIEVGRPLKDVTVYPGGIHQVEAASPSLSTLWLGDNVELLVME